MRSRASSGCAAGSILRYRDRAFVVALLVTLAVASIVMVAGMGRFTMALVARSPSPAARRRGAVHLPSWVVITGAIWLLAPASDTAAPPIAVVVLWPAGWAPFNAFWVSFWVAIGRANAPSVKPDLPPDVTRCPRSTND